MLLEKLRDYSERLDLPPAMYLKTRIRWLIDLDHDGHLLGIISTTGEESDRMDRGKEYLAPHVQVTSGIKAKIMVGDAKYVLGVVESNADERQKKRVSDCHQAFVNLVCECAQKTNEPAEPAQTAISL